MSTHHDTKQQALSALATLDANQLAALAAAQAKKPSKEAHPEPHETIIQLTEAAAQITPAAKGLAAHANDAVLQPTRRDVISDLPTMSAVTQLKGVRDQVDISVVSPSGGTLNGAHITEADAPERVDEKVASLYKLITDALAAGKAGMTIDVAVPGGRAAVYAVSVRADVFKNRRNGVVRMRCDEAASAHLIGVVRGLGGVAAFTKGETCTHEIIVPAKLFPASVILQILLQLSVHAIACRSYEYTKSMAYRFEVTSAAQLALIEKKGGVTLGQHGTFPVAALRPKLTFETIYALGCTGEGSARLDLLPEVRTALAVSKDLVSISQVAIHGRSKACVVAIKVPFSQVTYDAIYELLDGGRFKLINPRKPKCQPLEIFLAPTLPELQMVSGVMLLDPTAALAEAADEDDEEITIEDLSDPAAVA